MGDEFLVHHGIKGQRWGIRRFQNEDGTRTAAGKARERNGEQGSASDAKKRGLTDAQKSTLKKVAIGAGVAAAAGLAVYGAVKYSDAIKNAEFQHTSELGRQKLQEARDRMLLENAAYLQKMVDEGKADRFYVTNGNIAETGSRLKDEFKQIDRDKLYMDRASNLEKYGKLAEDMYGVTAEQVKNAKDKDEWRKLLSKIDK